MWYHYLLGVFLLALIGHAVYVQVTQQFSSVMFRMLYLIMPMVYAYLFYYWVYVPLNAPPPLFGGRRRY